MDQIQDVKKHRSDNFIIAPGKENSSLDFILLYALLFEFKGRHQ